MSFLASASWGDWVAQAAAFLLPRTVHSSSNFLSSCFLHTFSTFRIFRFLRVIASISLVSWRREPMVSVRPRQQTKESSVDSRKLLDNSDKKSHQHRSHLVGGQAKQRAITIVAPTHRPFAQSSTVGFRLSSRSSSRFARMHEYATF